MNIFISNLSFRVSDEDLLSLFGEYGAVKSAKVITDKFSGRSRGFGFVEIEDNEIAKKAIEELDGVEYDGRVIKVSEAKPRTENRDGKRRGGFNDRGDRGDRNDRNNNRVSYRN
ncbi:MAG TPA: RNA-binding protein [Bacteroidales bacterium]|nr:RNA-binding protein [Bacteroidales bacterium]HPS16239.1 RNA-binding protein [Bacteroidales bacterium]